MHSKLLDVIDARAADPELRKVPGGSTGIVTRDFGIDVPAIKEIRAIQLQVVGELGERLKGLGEIVPSVNATQVNVNVGIEGESQRVQEGLAAKENRPSLVDRMREVYGLGPKYRTNRRSVSVDIIPDDGNGTSGLGGGDTPTGADQKPTDAVIAHSVESVLPNHSNVPSEGS
jgi:hypothetical protein